MSIITFYLSMSIAWQLPTSVISVADTYFIHLLVRIKYFGSFVQLVCNQILLNLFLCKLYTTCPTKFLITYNVIDCLKENIFSVMKWFATFCPWNKRKARFCTWQLLNEAVHLNRELCVKTSEKWKQENSPG